MTDRFYQETPCPDCGQYAYGDIRYSGQHFLPTESMGSAPTACPGPGASRTELHPATPNYEAAWDSYCGLANRRRESGLVEMQVRQTVGAALVGVVLLQEPE